MSCRPCATQKREHDRPQSLLSTLLGSRASPTSIADPTAMPGNHAPRGRVTGPGPNKRTQIFFYHETASFDGTACVLARGRAVGGGEPAIVFGPRPCSSRPRRFTCLEAVLPLPATARSAGVLPRETAPSRGPGMTLLSYMHTWIDGCPQ